MGHPHLTSTHTKILLDQSSEKATQAHVKALRSFQEYERLLGLHIQSKEASPWEVACTWLKTDQVIFLSQTCQSELNTYNINASSRHGEHFLRSKNSFCTLVDSSQLADPGILIQSSLSVNSDLKINNFVQSQQNPTQNS